MLRSRILTGLFGAVLAGVLGSQMASCTLDVEGTAEKPPEVTKGGPCKDDGNCKDRLPCSPGVCDATEKVCFYTLLDKVDAPAEVQIAADCQKIVCVAGKDEVEPDDQDFKNDNNSCTTDACVAGASTNSIRPDGETCDVGVKNGICTAGKCDIACSKNDDCDDMNPCSDESCNTGVSKCVFTYLDGVLTPGAMQVTGDCKAKFCSNGMNGDVNDDADVNVDGNPCTDDICTAGMPSNPPFEPKTMCPPVAPSVTGVCDGAGLCVECVDKDDCTNIIESECEKRSCVNNKCVIAYEPQTTLASPVLQSDKDCKKVVCSGMAMPLTVTVNDDTDLPDDTNACTTDTCNNGMPAFTNKTQGTNCGGTQVCNDKGVCVGCNSPTDCQGTSDFCKTITCNSNICGVDYTPNGTDLMNGQTAGDCKVLECDGAGNVKTSVLQSDVPVDNNQCTNDVCNAQGTPSNPPTAINSMCTVGMNNACDGAGNCKKSLGLTCAAGNECVSTRCVDGVCCNSACTTLCEACNVGGSLGTCTAVPKGQDDGMCSGNTQSCNGSNDCDDENGIACAAGNACLSSFCVDGVCCNSACDTACKSCSVTGSLGTCSNSPAGSQDNVPTNLCVGQNQCDGNGVCKKINGGTCTMGSQCISGNCIDGYCCDTSCGADCKSCNVPGNLGTCTNVVVNTDDGACSGSSESCDGMGGCKLENGTACANDAECFSTKCIDGVCCATDCTGLCKACNVAGMLGVCNNIPAGSDPGMECADQGMATCGTNGSCDGVGACQKYATGVECAAQSCSGTTQTNADQCNGTGTCVDNGTTDCSPYNCNGSTGCRTSCSNDGHCVTNYRCSGGSCKKVDGQMCMNANECASNQCADGVCCNSSCTGDCKACNLAGSMGTCTNVGLGVNDTCPATQTCDNGGVCKLADNQPCTANSQCASNNCNNGNNKCQGP